MNKGYFYQNNVSLKSTRVCDICYYDLTYFQVSLDSCQNHTVCVKCTQRHRTVARFCPCCDFDFLHRSTTGDLSETEDEFEDPYEELFIQHLNAPWT